MIKLDRDIHSLTDFKRNTTEFVKQMKETKTAVVLTVNGKAELVVQDAESYQEMLDSIDRTESIRAIQEALDQADRGEGRPAAEVFAEIRKKYNIPDV